MKKICHIRGRHRYFENNIPFSVDLDDEARTFLGHYGSCGSMIQSWDEAFNIPYYIFRKNIRDIILKDIRSSNIFDYVCESDNEFVTLLARIPKKEKILVFQQDDDDIFLPSRICQEGYDYGATKFKLIALDFLNFHERGFKNKIPGDNNKNDKRVIYPLDFNIENHIHLEHIKQQNDILRDIKQQLKNKKTHELELKYKQHKANLKNILLEHNIIDRADYLGTNNYILNIEAGFFDYNDRKWNRESFQENMHRWFSNHHSLWPVIYYENIPITKKYDTSIGVYINHLSSLSILRGLKNKTFLQNRLDGIKIGIDKIFKNNINISPSDCIILKEINPVLTDIMEQYMKL